MHLANGLVTMDVETIAGQFATRGEITEVTPHGGGHINDSYHLFNGRETEPDYLLQRVNHYVFKDVDLLMQNMLQVTAHIRELVQKTDPGDLDQKTLAIIPTVKGEPYFKDPDGNYWRVLNFISDHVVFENTRDPELAYEGARMFGQFTQMLSGLDPSDLGETIPRFHDMKWRLSNLRESVRKNSAGRLSQVKDEVAYVESSAELMCTVQELGEKGIIPKRVTHNDTKINNVLFDRDHKGLCVIDLDTVMPGYVHFDYGDGIRTFTNTGEEDDEDLDRITMDLELFRAFTAGFLDSTRQILRKEETESLVYAGLMFPYIMGVRFLTDYLDGDVYYKVHHPEHNLVRARAQFRLAQDGESKLSALKKIISEYAQ